MYFFLEDSHSLGSLGVEVRPLKAHFDAIDRQRLQYECGRDANQATMNIDGRIIAVDIGCLIFGSVIIREESLSHFLDQESRKKVVEDYKKTFGRAILQHWRGVESMDDITVKFSSEDIERARDYFRLSKRVCVYHRRNIETPLTFFTVSTFANNVPFWQHDLTCSFSKMLLFNHIISLR